MDKLVKDYGGTNLIQNKEIQNKISDKINEINKDLGSLVPADYYHHKEKTEKLISGFKSYCEIRAQMLLDELSPEYLIRDIELVLEDIKKSTDD